MTLITTSTSLLSSVRTELSHLFPPHLVGQDVNVVSHVLGLDLVPDAVVILLTLQTLGVRLLHDVHLSGTRHAGSRLRPYACTCECVSVNLPTHQFIGSHLVENLFCVLAVVAALHDGQEQLRGVVLQHNVSVALKYFIYCDI